MKICNNCKKVVPNPKTNCPFCGSSNLSPYNLPTPSYSKEKKKKNKTSIKMSNDAKLIIGMCSFTVLLFIFIMIPQNFFGTWVHFVFGGIVAIVITYFLATAVGSPSNNKYIPTISRCPNCHSTNYTASNRWFGYKKAAIGGLALGPLGLLAGGIGSKKVKFICNNCGHTWSPNSIEVQIDREIQQKEHRIKHL